MRSRRVLLALIVAVALIMPMSATAQLRTSYFMEGSYFRTELNPALAPTRGFIALPAMSGVGVNLQSNFLAVDNLYKSYGGNYISVFDSRVSRDNALAGFVDVNNLKLNANVNLFGLGFYARRTYWNIGVNARVQGGAIMERAMFEGLKSGSQALYNSSMDLTSFAELYLGSAIPIGDNVTLGFRLKALFGMLNVNGTLSEASRNGDYGHLAGDFVFAGRPIERAEAKPNTKYEVNDVFDFRSYHLAGSPSNFGFAIDFGFEWRLLNDHLKLSVALADLGFITWSQKQMMGIKLDTQFDMSQSGLESSYMFGSPMFEMSSNPLAERADVRRMLNYSVNIGAELNFLRNHVAIGVLSHNVYCNNMLRYHEITTSLNIKPSHWLTLTGSHTFLSGNQPGVFGAAINIHPRVLNIFAGIDFIDYKMISMSNGGVAFHRPVSHSVYAGVGFNFARPRLVRIAEKEAKLERKIERQNRKNN